MSEFQLSEKQQKSIDKTFKEMQVGVIFPEEGTKEYKKKYKLFVKNIVDIFENQPEVKKKVTIKEKNNKVKVIPGNKND